MQTTEPTIKTPPVADKEALKRLVAEVYATLGVSTDPAATPQMARALMLKDGVRPEDNSFSCAILTARDG
jgi:hypothetical protein